MFEIVYSIILYLNSFVLNVICKEILVDIVSRDEYVTIFDFPVIKYSHK